MTKKEILDYITETPGNTNRAVLGDMLDSFGGGGSGDSYQPLIVNYDRTEDEKIWYDKTWQQVKDAYDAGVPIYLQYDAIRAYLMDVGFEEGIYFVHFVIFEALDEDSVSEKRMDLLADSADGYLYFVSGGNN